jgi:hypothetical protein
LGLSGKTIALILAIVLTISIIAIISFNIQSNRQLPIKEWKPDSIKHYNLTIVQFFSTHGWFVPGGVAMTVDFNLTILNGSDERINGSTLMIKRAELDNDPLNVTQTLEPINPGQAINVVSWITVGIDRYAFEFRYSNFTATVFFNNILLDQKTIQITERQF